VHGVALESSGWARQISLSLFLRRGEERPDGLIVADDNLVEAATAGVAAAGVRPPRDIEIVAMTNFPHAPAAAVPVTRLGFDISRLVAVGMESLTAQRRAGESAPQHVAMPAVFEKELDQVGDRRLAPDNPVEDS
jgi:DNA-binding LacI/PurR family transcriptional regulator